ncbi:MAG TPA: efflux RND transporter periplasmic adaptor subunit [Acidobacteriaceae bacterium]
MHKGCSTDHAALIATALVVFMLTGCNGSGSKAAASNGAGNSESATLFSVPQEQMAHLQVLTAEPSTLARNLRLTGTVAYNSFQTTPVITQVSGPVTRVVVVPGQGVRRGEPMLYVASPDYSQLRTNYLKAKDANALAQKTYARAKDLYQHHALAEQDVEQAESAQVQASGDLAAAAAALKVMGVADPDALLNTSASFEVPLRAPINGEVVEQDVSAGQLLQTGTTQCFMVSNTQTVWVLVDVYQKDLPYVHVGDPVTIQTDTYPDVFHGRISYIAAALDPNTRTLQARIETVNPADKLKKGMYVTASVNAGSVRNVVAVPDSAVLRDDENQPFIYVATSGDQFGRRSVTLGQSQNGTTQITSGLNPGDRFIGDGSLFVQFANSLQR